jgi:CHAT domain-containing protein
LLFHIGENEAAIAAYDKALALYRKLGDKLGEANCYLSQGDVAFLTGDNAGALALYAKAIPLYQAVGSKLGEAWACHGRGKCLEKQGDPAGAEVALDQALIAVESLREGAGAPSARSGVLEQFVTIYHTAIRLALASGKGERAFGLAERARGRSLLDLMASGGLQVYKRMNANERAEAQELEHRLALANARWAHALSQISPDPSKLKSLSEERDAARRTLDELEKSLYARYPDLAAARGARTVDAAPTASMLPADALLLEYIVTEEETLVFALSSQGISAILKAPMSSGMLAEEVAAFRQYCSREGGRSAEPAFRTAGPDRNDAGRKLFDALVKPVLDAMPARPKHLMIVPDGALFELPFQALSSGDSFLAEKCLVTYATSASLLKAALDESNRPDRPRPERTLLCFADPDFAGRSWQAALRGERGILTQLPGTLREAEALRDLIPDAAIFTGTAAQESAARIEAKRYRYVHFATHGLLDDTSPLYSALAMASPPADSQEDGFLEARELSQMTLSADLVVLSACETGRGTVRPGDGVMGLLWATTVAGAPTAVVSQWKVDDQATADLMKEFYSRLKRGVPRGQALREAQLVLIRDGKHRDPFYWAAFILAGDWR